MSADVLIFRPVFKSVRVDWRGAPRAFPLIQLYDPRQTVAGWTQFVRSHGRAGRSGVNAIEDQRGYLHAIFIWRVENHLLWRRTLRIATLVLGGLPGRAVQEAAGAALRELAHLLDCETILVEANEEHHGLHPQFLLMSGFTPVSGAVYMRKMDPL